MKYVSQSLDRRGIFMKSNSASFVTTLRAFLVAAVATLSLIAAPVSSCSKRG
jgi:hypothetical protein